MLRSMLVITLGLGLLSCQSAPTKKHSKKRGHKRRVATSAPNGLHERTIKSVFRKRQGEIRQCYLVANRRNPKGAKGSITLFYHIKRNGRIRNVAVQQRTVKDRRFTKCILHRISRWRFPRARAISEVDNHTLYF